MSVEQLSRHLLEGCPTRRKPRAVSTFLKKTYELLNQENWNAVRWASNGIGFIVVNEEAFAKEVLPRYFKHSNYSSFVRQLNMYSFHKIRQNNSESYFHHQSFDRTDPHKLTDIRRKPEKKKRKAEDSEEEPCSLTEQPLLPRAPKRAVQPLGVPARPLGPQGSTHKVGEQEEKNTRHYFSEECNGEREGGWQSEGRVQADDDKLSINNEISQRLIPRLGTRELIYPSNNNLFPFQSQGASHFCIFF